MKLILSLILFSLLVSCGSNKVIITGSRSYDKQDENIYPMPKKNNAVIYFIDNKKFNATFADKYIFSQYGEIGVYSPNKYSIYYATPGKLRLFIDGLEKRAKDDKDKGKKFISIDIKANNIYFVSLNLTKRILTGERVVTLKLIKVKNIISIFKYIKNNLSYITLPQKIIENTKKTETEFIEASKTLNEEEKNKLMSEYYKKSLQRMIKESVNREAKGRVLNSIIRGL